MFDRGQYSTESKEISLPYTEYSPSRSSSEYDHPRKANYRRSSQKYRLAEGDEYGRSPSLHRTKLKSSRTEYSDRSHRSPYTKYGRSPSERRKGIYEHYQRRSPSPSYSRRSPSSYSRHSSSRHSHSQAKSKAGRNIHQTDTMNMIPDLIVVIDIKALVEDIGHHQIRAIVLVIESTIRKCPNKNSPKNPETSKMSGKDSNLSN